MGIPVNRSRSEGQFTCQCELTGSPQDRPTLFVDRYLEKLFGNYLGKFNRRRKVALEARCRCLGVECLPVFRRMFTGV